MRKIPDYKFLVRFFNKNTGLQLVRYTTYARNMRTAIFKATHYFQQEYKVTVNTIDNYDVKSVRMRDIDKRKKKTSI